MAGKGQMIGVVLFVTGTKRKKQIVTIGGVCNVCSCRIILIITSMKATRCQVTIVHKNIVLTV